MKPNHVQDERILQQQRKIIGEAYSLVLLCLYLSAFIKQLVLDAPFSAYAAEICIAVGSCLYIMIRNLRLGVRHFYQRNPRFLILGSVMVGVIVLLISFGGNRTSYSDTAQMAVGLGLSLLSGIAAFLAVYLLLRTLERRRMHAIEKQLDADENNLDD